MLLSTVPGTNALSNGEARQRLKKTRGEDRMENGTGTGTGTGTHPQGPSMSGTEPTLHSVLGTSTGLGGTVKASRTVFRLVALRASCVPLAHVGSWSGQGCARTPHLSAQTHGPWVSYPVFVSSSPRVSTLGTNGGAPHIIIVVIRAPSLFGLAIRGVLRAGRGSPEGAPRRKRKGEILVYT